jgi:hypothetical protein
MIAAAFATGMATGVVIVLIATARQNAREHRDRKAFEQHIAMVRALSAVATPRRSTR